MPEHNLKMVEEAEAAGEVAGLYETIKHEFQVPSVPNIMKTIAISPSSLQFYVDMFVSFHKNITLPEDLVTLIFYAVAKKSNSPYSTAAHEMMCRKLGIDEITLNALPKNLDDIPLERTRAIIEFALKGAKSPQTLVNEDYDKLRGLDIKNDEILEILFVASLAVYFTLIADALNVEVDPELADNMV